jgi:hypothetical protein
MRIGRLTVAKGPLLCPYLLVYPGQRLWGIQETLYGMETWPSVPDRRMYSLIYELMTGDQRAEWDSVEREAAFDTFPNISGALQCLVRQDLTQSSTLFADFEWKGNKCETGPSKLSSKLLKIDILWKISFKLVILALPCHIVGDQSIADLENKANDSHCQSSHVHGPT